MDTKQALSVIKQILDAASKGGIFENMNASFLAAQSFNLISQQLLKDEKTESDANGVIS
jgi:hypothetical protein